MYLFIVNLVSGNNRGKDVWYYVQQQLVYNQIPYQVEFTQYPGHATEIAQRAIHQNHFKAIVAVGGDGTANEVGNALIGTSIPMGYIPAGTGNDFALAHKIPLDPVYALDRIRKHNVQRIDTADLGHRKMIGFMGIGFDGKVAETVNLSPKKRRLGRLTYGLEALRVLKQFQPSHYSLTIDGQSFEYDGVWLIAITNIANYAGGMKICPDAKFDDGQLDLCCVRNLTPGQFLRIFPSVYSGKHIHHPSIHFHRGKEFSIESDSQPTVHVDGEVIANTPLSVRVLPESLLVL